MRTMFLMGLAAVVGLAFGGVGLAEEVGPHKGPVAEWGEEEYHLEVVADAKTGEVMVYIYSGDHEELKKGRRSPSTPRRSCCRSKPPNPRRR